MKIDTEAIATVDKEIILCNNSQSGKFNLTTV
jgi:hypothetical protein